MPLTTISDTAVDLADGEIDCVATGVWAPGSASAAAASAGHSDAVKARPLAAPQSRAFAPFTTIVASPDSRVFSAVDITAARAGVAPCTDRRRLPAGAVSLGAGRAAGSRTAQSGAAAARRGIRRLAAFVALGGGFCARKRQQCRQNLRRKRPWIRPMTWSFETAW